MKRGVVVVMNTTNSVNIIKSANQNTVLAEILKNTEFTKRSLADITTLTFPTVSKIVDDLEQGRQITQTGKTLPTNGRKAAVYRLNPDFAFTLSVYFQYEKFTAVIGNTAKKILLLKEHSLDNKGYVCTLEQIIAENLAEYPNIKAISIGVPAGVVDGKITYINHYDELRGLDITEHFKSKFSLPVIVERDMYIFMQGISLQTEYQNDKNLAVIILTADVPGCCTMLSGNILKGFSGFAGEVGYLPVYDNTNLQQIAETAFENTDLTDYTARLIACICAVVNPQKIVVLDNEFAPKSKSELEKACCSYLPTAALPQIEICDDYHLLYREGLLELARQLLFEVTE